MEEFNLEGSDFIALSDLLKITAVAQTGGHAKILISEGDVLVDGEVETRKKCKIKSGQVVEVNGDKIKVI